MTVVAVALIVIIVVAAVSVYFLTQQNKPFLNYVAREEFIGGYYNATFKIIEPDAFGRASGDLIYVKNGTEHVGYFSESMNNSMMWIRDNLPSDAVFFNWWDYGHAIAAVGERESISKNPSREALPSVNVVGAPINEFDSHQIITDVATAFTTTDENSTVKAMQKYGATYLYITAEDESLKVRWLFNFSSIDSAVYFGPTVNESGGQVMWYNDLGKQTMIYRLFENTGLTSFSLVYSDGYAKIYRLNS